MTENRLIGECIFCPIGEEDKRGVVQTQRESAPHIGFEDRGPITIIEYKCALGEAGKECIIPKIYQLAYEGTQIGREGDSRSMRIGQPF